MTEYTAPVESLMNITDSFEFMSPYALNCMQCWDFFLSPGWWELVDMKRVRLLGVSAHIHRSLSLLGH